MYASLDGCNVVLYVVFFEDVDLLCIFVLVCHQLFVSVGEIINCVSLWNCVLSLIVLFLLAHVFDIMNSFYVYRYTWMHT